MDIDGGGVDGPPLDREPITGPEGVLLGGAGGAEVVGLGAEVGCGRLDTGAFEEDEDGFFFCESLMAPPLGRSPVEADPCTIAAPLGRSLSPEPAVPVGLDETPALFVNGAGRWSTVLLQAAQTRAAATAVAAALAGATVPRIGMDATVAS